LKLASWVSPRELRSGRGPACPVKLFFTVRKKKHKEGTDYPALMVIKRSFFGKEGGKTPSQTSFPRRTSGEKGKKTQEPHLLRNCPSTRKDFRGVKNLAESASPGLRNEAPEVPEGPEIYDQPGRKNVQSTFERSSPPRKSREASGTGGGRQKIVCPKPKGAGGEVSENFFKKTAAAHPSVHLRVIRKS